MSNAHATRQAVSSGQTLYVNWVFTTGASISGGTSHGSSQSVGYGIVCTCEVCGSPADPDDSISARTNGKTIYFHKTCYLSDPQAVKAIIVLEDVTP